MNENVYERIVELCEEKDISQRQLQRDLNLAVGTISKWTKATPRIDTLQKVADYFSVTTDYLTGRTKYRNRDHMLQSFDENADMKKLLDGNTEIPYDQCIQTEEGIMLIESMTAAPKYIDPETRQIAEQIQADDQLKRMMKYLEHFSQKKIDAIYNMMVAMDDVTEE